MKRMQRLIGDIQWTRPPWLQDRRGRRALVVIAGMLVAGAAMALLLAWNGSLPQPPRVVVTVAAPGITPVVEGELRPEPLTLNFSVRVDPRMPRLASNSVARLDLVGEPVPDGVVLSPAVAGEWRWLDDHTLQFAPDEDWPAGQRYTVSYSPAVFATELEFAALDVDFETPPFAASLDDAGFYQDPVDAGLRKVVAELRFTHPVSADELDEHVTLTMRKSGATIDTAGNRVTHELRFGEQNRTAWIHSAPLDIPPEENYLTVELAAGLAPVSGPSRTNEALVDSVRIPDIDSYFQVSGAGAIIARDADNEPVQAITLQFSDAVAADALAGYVDAWLLPESVVINGVRRNNYRWQSPREVTTAVLREAEQVDLPLAPTERDSAMLHSAAVDLPGGRYAYLRVRRGLESRNEFVLSRDFDTVVRLPAWPREVRIAQEGAVLPLRGSHRLTFVARGLDTLKVELRRLHPDEVNHVASQTSGDLDDPRFDNWRFNEDNVTSRTTRFIDLNADSPARATYASLDLTDLLPDGGYWFVDVRGWDREDERVVGSGDRRFVLITDIGLMVKSNADASQDLFAHSLATGLPLAGVNVALLGRNGVAIVERTTDANGHASMPPVDGFEREQLPTVFVARRGDDAVFMPFARQQRQLQYSRFDVGGQFRAPAADELRLRAQVFSDRGIYRPGDDGRLAAVVKRDDWRPVGPLPLVLRVYDSRSQLVLDERLELPADGFLEQSFATEAASATGDYRAILYLVDGDENWRSIGDTAFRVEEFLPDRLRINAEIEGIKPAGWLAPDAVVARVDLDNLFGAPAQARRVSGRFELTPTTIAIPGFDGYTFTDPLREDGTLPQPQRATLADAQTDDQGIARLPVDLSRYAAGIYRLAVTTDGFELDGGRSVRARSSVIVSPLDVVVGFRSDSDLAYLHLGSPHDIGLVAVDSDANAVDRDGLTLTLVEKRQVSTLVERDNGTYAYQSVTKEVPLDTKPFAIAAGGTTTPLPTDAPGRFALLVTDEDGAVVARVPFTVAGDGNREGNLERDAELTVNVDGDRFAPGDEIRLEVTAPYTGAGLITVESDRVHAFRWIRSDTTTSVHSIRVPDGLEGNAYVNIAFVRDPASPEIYTTPLSYAVVPIAIDSTPRRVDIELDVPALVRPGKELTIAHRSSRPSRIVVFAVDEGILQVADYATPDPLAFFLPKMALQVATFQIADLLLPEFVPPARRAAPGGGDAVGLAGSNLNPFRRRSDAPVAFWSGIVDSGPAAASVAFDVPDYFNGELRIMAIAVAADAVGSADAATTVRAPFIVTPNVLTATAPGDEFDVVVGVSNQLDGSDSSMPIRLQASGSDNLEIVGEAAQDLRLDEGDETGVRYRVRALDRPGGAELRFTASAGDESATAAATLSIRPPVARVATLQSGRSDGRIEVELPRRLYAPFGEQTAAASSSPLILADGMLDYLDAFPHACAEQIVSKVFPQLGFLGRNDPAVDDAAVRQQFATTIGKLRSRQRADGGFRFWLTSAEAAPFPSAYITHFLLDARELGLPVPGDMLTAAVDFTGGIAARPVGTIVDARLRAYAIYLVTRSGSVTTNALTNLHETLDREHGDDWRGDIAAAYMAASYALLQQQRLGDDLIAGYEIAGGDERTHDFDTRLGRDAQFLYLLARHFPARLETVGGDLVGSLVDGVMQDRFNTLSAAYTILALRAYSDAVAAGGSRRLQIAAGDDAQMAVVAEALDTVRAALDNDVARVAIEGDGTLFYLLSQTGFDREPPATAGAEGLEISRAWLDADGNEVRTASAGEDLTVRLRIRSTGRFRSNVAVVDLLPGGFEVDTDSIDRRFDWWNSDYVDVREDRVVVYGGFSDRLTEIRYRVRVTTAGDFVVPAAFAGSMYDRSVHARTAPGRITVAPPP